MRIGIIGSGNIGLAFAKQAAKAGYEVLISNSRGPESLAEAVNSLNGNAKAVTVAEAALADVVFLSLPWKYMEAVTTAITTWEGRTVIDPSNPIIMPGFTIAELGGKPSSEVVSGWVKGANVVKAFNTYTPQVLEADPNVDGGRRVIFYSGNHTQSKETVADIIKTMGFAGIDLGTLQGGGMMQQFPGGPLAGQNLVKVS